MTGRLRVEIINVCKWRRLGPPGVLGIWGEWLFVFGELGSTGNYFQGFGEQAHSFGDLGSPAKQCKKNNFKGLGSKGKYFQGAKVLSFRELGRSMNYFQGSREHRPLPLGGVKALDAQLRLSLRWLHFGYKVPLSHGMG